MPTRQKQSFFKGALMLTAATLLVKIIGMFYKIPVYNILGAVGWSCFNVAYGIFTPVYSLSVSGFPAAISKLVSENAAAGWYRDVRKIFRISMLLLLGLGVLGFVILFFGADLLAGAVGNRDARLAVMVMAPSLLFCCVMAAVRGYQQGLRNMAPTAVSQIIESVGKLVFGVGFAYWVLGLGLRQFTDTGLVFGQAANTLPEAQLLALPYAAAGAVLGVSVSTVLGALYLLLRQVAWGDGIPRREVAASPAPRTGGRIIRSLVRLALPVCLASVLAHVTNLIDLATVIHRVGVAMERDSATVLAMYRGLIPPEVNLANIPKYLQGAYGSTSSLYNLVPSLTATLGISVLPLIAANWANRARDKATQQMYSVIKLAALVSIPAGLGLAVLARPIMDLLYAARPLDVAIAAPVLRTMGLAMVLVGITTPISSMFQAIGRADIPVKLMAAGAVLKVLSNYFLVAIPTLNIQAVPYGTTLCYGFIFVGSLVGLGRNTREPIPLGKVLIKPLCCGLICAFAAHTSFELLYRLLPSHLTCLLAIAISGAIYLIFVLFLRIITKNEVFMLPVGKKVAKTLEKLSLLG